ncbi:MAG: glyoxylate/hydroxypyruvate reductase A [Betaproteobacteria bacterium]
MDIVLCAQVKDIGQWQQELVAAFHGEPIAIWPDIPDRNAIAIALVAKPPRGVWSEFPNLKLICSLWAGVDGLLADPAFPKTLPFTRLIDPQLAAAMVETVLLHVLCAHRLAPRYRVQQVRVEWLQHLQPQAAERTVAILGFGELGRACADALLPLGFPVLGWSRTPHRHPRVECFDGEARLHEVLARADIVVSLLPITAGTRRLLNAARLALLPAGATVINVGRGGVIDDAALVAALDAGRLEAAILDVYDEEPLPPAHPFWRHERVWVYPHVAAETDPRTAAKIVADTVRRFRAGEPLAERVDRVRGY